MTLEISGWTIVWLFLLILVLAIATTAWIFLFFIKSKSSDLPSPENDSDDDTQQKSGAGRSSVTKTYLDKKITDLLTKLEKNRDAGQSSLEKKVDKLVEQVESENLQLERLGKVLDDKDKLLKKMEQHFNGFKECASCGYNYVPVDEDAIHCPRCGENPNIKKTAVSSSVSY